MAITKTNFINYTRCPRYAALDNVKKEKLQSVISFEEYKQEENAEKLKEILNSMYDGDNDLIDVADEQMEVMLPYYNKVELLAGNLAEKYFKGTFKYAENTKEQESFDCVISNIRYLCYVDIYNEVDDHFNIIEVKATTSKKFLSLAYKTNGQSFPIFTKNEKGIYHLLEEDNIYYNKEKYEVQRAKLFDRFSPAGKYVYDLAVQRYIIENDLKQNGQSQKINKIKYYLAVLNADYVFDGTYKYDAPVYNTDSNGNDIICYFDMTSITKDYLDKIDLDRIKVQGYVNDLKADAFPLGRYCEYKSISGCKYKDICFKCLPKENSIFAYLDNHHGFKEKNNKKHETYDLINKGMVHMLDVPISYLNRKKNIIQRKTVEDNIPYINKEKIKQGLKEIKYPIYHLDFETFPCPLPRYKGEKCYTQSVFQFSLHIQKDSCDKDKDHYEFLAPDHLDHREELIQKMCEYIKEDGTVLVYNDSFEKTRLKELAQIFPEYADKLMHIRDMVFDLMNLVKTKSSLYEALGYSKEEASLFNYYHKDMNGSFSIKKVLPLFSDLSYKNMEIGNGVEALVTYAKFDKMDEKEYKHKYQKLVEYCKQDTWAMVCVLNGLRDCVK